MTTSAAESTADTVMLLSWRPLPIITRRAVPNRP
jgi:hypothetical protein